MSDDTPERPIETLDKRLANARGRAHEFSQERDEKKLPPGNALGLAFRIGVELVSAVAIGLAIGWLLDRWLDTKPWLMLVFIFMGGAAGILNVYRMARGFGYAVGYQQNEGTRDDEPRNEG